MVRVKEGDATVALPAVQAVIRMYIALAAKGNGPALRSFIAMLEATERESAAKIEATTNTNDATPQMSHLDVARRIAFALERGRRELEKREKAKRPDD